MYRTKLRQGKPALKPQPRTRLRFRSGRHDRWLVLNMSMFNFQPGQNEIFNPTRSHENVWS